MTPLPSSLLIDPLTIAPPGASLGLLATALFESQRLQWPLLKTNDAGLEHVRVRSLHTPGGRFLVQSNPGRIVSTTAPVDPEAIRKRPCFLCPANLPSPQRGIEAGDGFLLLCNPYPIFRKHFTIAHADHIPQQIAGRFGVFLRLIREMAPEFTILYNGPRCGASAPDHLHFQAGERSVLPIETELAARWRTGEVLKVEGPAEMRRIDDGIRWYIAVSSPDDGPALRLLEETYRELAARDLSGDEPMLNILGWEEDGCVKVLLFSRKAHRPKRYSVEGDDKLVISPAATDCGGLVITPVERDFHQMDEALLREIFHEVLADRVRT
jgi:hypothetical protein